MEGLGFLGAENTLRAKMLIIILVVVEDRENTLNPIINYSYYQLLRCL